MRSGILKVMENRLRRLGDFHPRDNAQEFLDLLNRMFGKTIYTDEQFEEAYAIHSEIHARDLDNVEYDNEFIDKHFCYKPPVMIGGIAVRKRDHTEEWRKFIDNQYKKEEEEEEESDEELYIPDPVPEEPEESHLSGPIIVNHHNNVEQPNVGLLFRH